MGVLGLLVKDHHPAVHMLDPDIIPLVLYQVEQDILSHIPQIPCDDPVIVLHSPSEILQVLYDRIHGGRSHTGAHILRILQAVIHDLPHGHTGDPHMALLRPHQERAAPCHRPMCRQRTLVRVPKRETKFLLRASEVAGGHCKHTVPIARGHAHGAQCQRFPGCGAGAIEPEQRNLQRLDPHGCGDPLPEQIPAE